MKNIYKSDGKYYKKIDTCYGRFGGMYKWQPMIKILWLYIPNFKREKFILDDYGFEEVK